MFRAISRAFMAGEVSSIVSGYVNSTPLYDHGVGRTVTRQHTVTKVPGQAAVRITCRVLLHEGTNLDPGEFNAEWTRGLLGELATLLNAHGFIVNWEDTGGGPVLIVSRS